jgi:hypothetical protein
MVTIIAISSVLLFAKPKYHSHSHYRGADGKWYWCEFYTDDVTGDDYTLVYVHPDKTPHHGNGHITPNKLIADGNGTSNLQDTLSPFVPEDDFLNVCFIASEEGIDVKADANITFDIVDLTGNVVAANIFVQGNSQYQTIPIPNGVDIRFTYGFIAKSDGAPFYARAFRFDGYEIVPY